MKRIPALNTLACCIGLSMASLARGQAAPDAPTGFDNETNGFLPQATFEAYQAVFEQRYTVSDGLGPIYETQSCAECHQNPVTGGTSQITSLWAGRFDGTHFIEHPGGAHIQSRAIDAAIQERVLSGNEVRTFRTSLNTLGNGYVESVADEKLREIQAAQPAAMRGELVMVSVLEAGGAMRAGRFGLKDQHASLLSKSAEAARNYLGITSVWLPDENTSNGNPLTAYDTVADPEDAGGVEAVTAFMRSTKAPPRDTALGGTPGALAGARVFVQVGCAVCHQPTIVTAPPGTLINGGMFTVPPALGSKTIRPYGDFLLHDVGTGDGIVQNGLETTRNKVRTAPLWGLRTRNRLMHDGLSLTMPDAIARHQSEAADVTARYLALTPEQRNQVLTFLRSL